MLVKWRVQENRLDDFHQYLLSVNTSAERLTWQRYSSELPGFPKLLKKGEFLSPRKERQEVTEK